MKTFVITYWSMTDAKRTVEIVAASFDDALQILKDDIDQVYTFAQLSSWYQKREAE